MLIDIVHPAKARTQPALLCLSHIYDGKYKKVCNVARGRKLESKTTLSGPRPFKTPPRSH